MSSDDAFRNQFEKLVKDNGWTLEELKENMLKEGGGFRERFEKISGILLLHSPKDDKE